MDLTPAAEPGAPIDPRESTRLTTNHRKAANVRTALVFASIAVTFFVGIIVAHAVGGPVIGVGVVGFVVLLFLVFAIGRNLRAGGRGNNRGPEEGR